MAKGENIFKRKDGRWEARYIKGYELNGKIKYGYCYGKTYKIAKEKVSLCKSAVLQKQEIHSSRNTQNFSYYCDHWLFSIQHRIKESTYVKYESILNRYIKKYLGSYETHHLSNAVIESFTNHLLNTEKLALKTTKDILVILHSVLCYTSKQIPGKPMNLDIIYPKEERKEMRILTRDEQTLFIHYLMNPLDECKFGILLAMFTGLRIGEICALRWKDISFSSKTIKICSAMQRLKSLSDESTQKTRILISTPKSEFSFRLIPLTDSLLALAERMYPGNPDAYVLTASNNYMEPRTLQYRLKKYTKACSLENVHFHVLRHTFATRCVEAGFEIKSLSEILGHSTTSITLNRYVHSSLELKRSNMEKLDSML